MSTRGRVVSCPCGSGEPSVWLRDGYGIELCRACSACREERLARYRPDIMERYETDEPVEPEP